MKKQVAFFDMDGTIVAPLFRTNSGGGVTYSDLESQNG